MKVLNKIFLQWFFIRLTKNTTKIIDEFDMTEISLAYGTGHAMGGAIKRYHIEYYYSIQGWIVPLSGWTTAFNYLGKKSPWFIKITKTYAKVKS